MALHQAAAPGAAAMFAAVAVVAVAELASHPVAAPVEDLQKKLEKERYRTTDSAAHEKAMPKLTSLSYKNFSPGHPAHQLA